ncbi:MAG: efflux RND transporter periplasmic adaptor subunit [Planctomycetes bacterium]|nr:efflux RND transporter periplasmic adaptor subunit [Planctomycetota bacterium]
MPLRERARARALILPALVLAGCAKSESPAPRPARPVPLVVVQTVAKKPAVHRLEAVGDLRPNEDALVPTKVSGVILKVLFQEGDRVQPGAVLVEIDPTDYRLSAGRAKAAVSLARSDVSVKESLAAAAAARGSEARAQLASAEAQVASAELAVTLAEAEVTVVEASLAADQTGLTRAQAFQAEAEARQKGAQAASALAADTLERKAALRKDGYLTEEVYLAAKADSESAQARLEEAHAAVESARVGIQQAGAQVSVSEAKRETARKRVLQARSQAAQARIQVDLMKARVEEAQAQHQAAQGEIGRSRAAVEQAEADLALAEQALAETQVRTAVGGTIVARTSSAGEWAKDDTTVARIVDNRTLKVRFTLPEGDAAMVRPGMTVRFTIDSHPGREFEATVFFVSEHADPSSRTVEVMAKLDNAAMGLRSGIFCRVLMDAPSLEDTMIVPETAVLPTESGFVAFVLDGDAVMKRDVHLGLRSRGTVEVIRGLEEGETLVVRGAHSLTHGIKVRVQPDAEKP